MGKALRYKRRLPTLSSQSSEHWVMPYPHDQRKETDKTSNSTQLSLNVEQGDINLAT
uniref:Uncharacterized protein n=1 Tax=Rhizophora mucronata TaxID=61149 RepID=A0A2P2LAU0_RHIMU